ncbi:hypothetical protein AGR56_06090 [Clostridium sp. DMHC 10]|uniref:hypothetical protein n=1 Tax=Clostridium sp. DMHC 10 TaxID=747377 RepID=UPI00069E0715|nr:hypothetical protein [Clostridium sp. DMHC 10]KOF56380.1 hypothetical protein AGR56_06090 [Clostridium sp. DMHC 10]
MSDENKYSEEQAPDEVLEENKSEQESKEEATEEMLEELTDVTSEKIPFPRVIYSVFVDQVVLFALSGILLLITGFVLKKCVLFLYKRCYCNVFLDLCNM